MLNSIITRDRLPTYPELKKLSYFFKAPISTLLKKLEDEKQANFLYRKAVDENVSISDIDRYNQFITCVLELECDSNRVAPIKEVFEIVDNTYANAEVLARKFRLLFFNGNMVDPLIDLPKILSEKLGFIVKVLEGGNRVDGASAFVNNWVFLFVSPRFIGRMLFTLAHELAHILNHHGEGDFIHLDEKIYENSKNVKGDQERFANYFASALLLPIQGIAKMLNTLRKIQKIPPDAAIGDIEILYIARFYGVSFDVVANRLEMLDLIPEGGSYSLSQKLKENHGSAEKRANELELPSRPITNFDILPSFLVQKALMLIDQGKYSSERIAQMLQISIHRLMKYNAELGRK